MDEPLDLINRAETLQHHPPRNLNDYITLREQLYRAAERLNDQEPLSAEDGSLVESLVAYGRTMDECYSSARQQDQQAARRLAIAEARQGTRADHAPLGGMPLERMPGAITVMDGTRYTANQGAFRSWADYLIAVRDAFTPGIGRRDDRLVIRGEAGMWTGDGSAGGFLVPPNYSNDLLLAAGQDTMALLPRTRQFPITVGDSITLPVNGETSRQTGSRWGGISSHWISEGAQKPTSFPRVRQLELRLGELAIIVPVSDRLLRSGGSAVEQYVKLAATDEIVWRTNEGIVRGLGTGQPLGIINSGALITVEPETSQGKTITLTNVNKMFSRLLPKARRNAVWLVSTSALEQLEALSATVGTGGLPVYLPTLDGTPNVSGTPIALSTTPRLKGLEVIECEQCSALGDVGDLILCNLGWIASLVRAQGVEEATSMHLYFDTDQTAFRFVLEVDCEPILAQPIAPAFGTDTLSAYVALADRT